MDPIQVIPVIMSGGAGSRLWPLSRQAMPKQLLPLVTELTMVQETALRFGGTGFGAPVFICNALHAAPIEAQMKAIDTEVDAVIIEPAGRNTAPCAVVAACHVQKTSPGALVLLVPADHHVRDPQAFREAIEAAIPAAKAGHLVTFGITPDRPETGYGYIQKGGALMDGVSQVAAFKEKPDAATAARYIYTGEYAWNAGIFLFSPDAFLGEVGQFVPEIGEQALKAYEKAVSEGKRIKLDAETFAACPAESIDYAVMETTGKAAVVPCDIGWSDIGSFASLQDVRQDETGNALSGDIITVNTENSLIMTDGPLVSAVGLNNVAIIVHEGQILVTHLDAAQDVKAVVEQLKKSNQTQRL
ncbi:MAG: mannose-1-phosphate guanylyltransferase/mannose-6-phosphate isomerase [Alphaproteobacteria bacterium]